MNEAVKKAFNNIEWSTWIRNVVMIIGVFFTVAASVWWFGEQYGQSQAQNAAAEKLNKKREEILGVKEQKFIDAIDRLTTGLTRTNDQLSNLQLSLQKDISKIRKDMNHMKIDLTSVKKDIEYMKESGD